MTGALRRALGALPARWKRLWRSGQSGQALVESSVLLVTLLGGLLVGGTWLMKSHPDAMNALNIYVQGIYFTYSLPFP
jgi:hypothetical protein